MASDEELKAMGILNNNMKNNNSNRNVSLQTNKVATIIKALSIITGIVGAIFGLYSLDAFNSDELGVVIIIASVISAVFIYALGEIIQLLEDIKNK